MERFNERNMFELKKIDNFTRQGDHKMDKFMMIHVAVYFAAFNHKLFAAREKLNSNDNRPCCVLDTGPEYYCL